jgi:phosphatidylglycerol:prolipoprotein diacylglycerol transferase
LSTATVKLGLITFHWYGLVIALALLCALCVAVVLARLRGQPLEPLAGIFLVGVLAGVSGARVWYFLFNRSFYDPDPGSVFAVWQGGLALQGAIIAGTLAVAIYTWCRELDFWAWADICAPAVIIGQAIGRLGDIVNNQAFGLPTSGPAVVIPLENRPVQYMGFSHFTPVAAYEAVWDAVIFAVLLGLFILQQRRSHLLPSGSIFLAYLVLYSIGRIPLEGMRLDSLWIDGMRVAQVASWALIALGLLTYVSRLIPRRSPAPALAPSSPLQPSQAYLIAATRGRHGVNSADALMTAEWQPRADTTARLPRAQLGDPARHGTPPEETV